MTGFLYKILVNSIQTLVIKSVKLTKTSSNRSVIIVHPIDRKSSKSSRSITEGNIDRSNYINRSVLASGCICFLVNNTKPVHSVTAVEFQMTPS